MNINSKAVCVLYICKLASSPGHSPPKSGEWPGDEAIPKLTTTIDRPWIKYRAVWHTDRNYSNIYNFWCSKL